jgi:hypothetical protein
MQILMAVAMTVSMVVRRQCHLIGRLTVTITIIKYIYISNVCRIKCLYNKNDKKSTGQCGKTNIERNSCMTLKSKKVKK